MNRIAEEINESLSEKGSISMSELTNVYELPADFLTEVNRIYTHFLKIITVF
jgi:hypothetical protein